MEKTTIQINRVTLDRIKMFKKFERESYDEVLNGLLDDAEEESLTPEEIEEMKKGLDDIKHSRTYTMAEVAKRFGVKL